MGRSALRSEGARDCVSGGAAAGARAPRLYDRRQHGGEPRRSRTSPRASAFFRAPPASTSPSRSSTTRARAATRARFSSGSPTRCWSRCSASRSRPCSASRSASRASRRTGSSRGSPSPTSRSCATCRSCCSSSSGTSPCCARCPCRRRRSRAGGIYLDTRGLHGPRPVLGPVGGIALALGLMVGIGAAIAVARWAARRREETGEPFPVALGGDRSHRRDAASRSVCLPAGHSPSRPRASDASTSKGGSRCSRSSWRSSSDLPSTRPPSLPRS